MGELATEDLHYDLATDTSKRPLRIGLIANGFVDSDLFRDALGHTLTIQLPGLDLRYLEKPDAAVDLTDEQLVELQDCHAAAVAYAH